MASFAVPSFIALAALFVTGCGGVADSSTETAAQGGNAANVPLVRKVERAADGSLRVPYLGGAFVTYNREMPIEVEQAIAGLPTDRPVIVWAGKD